MGGRPEKPGASGTAQPLPDIRLVEHRRHSCYELVASLTIILSADSFIFRAMTPMIRPFRQQDADKLAALWHESWRSTGVQASSQTSLAQLRHRVSLELSDGWDVTVAEYEGDLLGFVALKRANHCLDQLFIAPRAKRLGIGRELLGQLSAVSGISTGWDTIGSKCSNRRADRIVAASTRWRNHRSTWSDEALQRQGVGSSHQRQA